MRERVANHIMRGRRSGFTLAEVLVALAVVSVATWILISLFNASLRLDKESRSMRVAAELAKEKLTDMRTSPDKYAWPANPALAEGKQVQVAPMRKDAQGADGFAPPKAQPTSPREAERENAFYDRYSWKAYARKPAGDSSFLEVTVVVQWTEAQREREFTLTSSIPVALTEGTA